MLLLSRDLHLVLVIESNARAAQFVSSFDGEICDLGRKKYRHCIMLCPIVFFLQKKEVHELVPIYLTACVGIDFHEHVGCLFGGVVRCKNVTVSRTEKAICLQRFTFGQDAGENFVEIRLVETSALVDALIEGIF